MAYTITSSSFLAVLLKSRLLPIFEPRDLNIDVKVQFLEGRKGDRPQQERWTELNAGSPMALLECRNSEQAVDGLNTVYLLDEPDTPSPC